jgi:hypothetical protein
MIESIQYVTTCFKCNNQDDGEKTSAWQCSQTFSSIVRAVALKLCNNLVLSINNNPSNFQRICFC